MLFINFRGEARGAGTRFGCNGARMAYLRDLLPAIGNELESLAIHDLCRKMEVYDGPSTDWAGKYRTCG